MNINYLRNFRYKKSEKHLKEYNFSVSGKQKFSLVILFVSIGYVSLFAQFTPPPTLNTKTISEILNTVPGGGLINIAGFYTTSFGFLDIVKNIINYIIESQARGTQTIAAAKFGTSSMFSRINNGVTIFAVIACGYKILMHYLKTERYDNVNAFTGFFGYVGILILFLFSDTIVTRLVGLNSSINQSAISNIGNKINTELDQQIALDYGNLVAQLKDIETEYTSITNESSFTDLPAVVKNRATYYGKTSSFYVGNIGKYMYFSTFGILLTSILAIPVFIMTLMVKILLSVMTFGTKLVFLLAFIPGFENTWKTFVLNLLHVLLWIPIFNAIIAFILQIISATMVSGSMTGGQVVWLTIVAIICAFQSISLTTSSAGVIINGAGASMAGALGSMGAMSAGAMAGGAISGAVQLGGAAASGGAGAAVAGANMASKLSKN